MLDFWLMVEFSEVVCIAWYLLTTKQEHADKHTQALLMGIALILALDVFVLNRHRPNWFRDAFNAYSFLVCYEKIFKKYWVVVFRKLGNL